MEEIEECKIYINRVVFVKGEETSVHKGKGSVVWKLKRNI